MADKYVAYVGSYTRGESDGIYILDANVEYAYFKVRDSSHPRRWMSKSMVRQQLE